MAAPRRLSPSAAAYPALLATSNRQSYEKLEPLVTYTKHTLGPVSNRQSTALHPRCAVNFRPLTFNPQLPFCYNQLVDGLHPAMLPSGSAANGGGTGGQHERLPVCKKCRQRQSHRA